MSPETDRANLRWLWCLQTIPSSVDWESRWVVEPLNNQNQPRTGQAQRSRLLRKRGHMVFRTIFLAWNFTKWTVQLKCGFGLYEVKFNSACGRDLN